MKKIFLALAISSVFIACNDSADTSNNAKDSIDSITEARKDNIDSMGEERKDALDSLGERKKDAIDRVDSLNRADTNNARK